MRVSNPPIKSRQLPNELEHIGRFTIQQAFILATDCESSRLLPSTKVFLGVKRPPSLNIIINNKVPRPRLDLAVHGPRYRVRLHKLPDGLVVLAHVHAVHVRRQPALVAAPHERHDPDVCGAHQAVAEVLYAVI